MKLLSRIKSIFGGRTAGSFFWPGTSPNTTISREQSLLEYQGVVYAVVTKIADTFAKLELQVYKKSDPKHKPLKNHEIIDILQRPNPMYSGYQYLRLHQIYMGLVGESYWYTLPRKITGRPTAFYLIRPDKMQVVVDQNDPLGHVIGYVMHKGNGQKVPFEYNEILHFKLPNPYDPYYGIGPLQAGYIRVLTEKYATDFTANSILNSGRPSGIVNFKGKINQDEFEQIKKRFKLEYSGTKNTGKTMFINGAESLDYQKLGMELGEVALKEIKDLSRDDIMLMWTVSKTMLGISEDVTLNNARESRQVFDENVIDPKRFEFVDHLTTFALPKWSDDLVLDYVNRRQYTLKEKVEEWNSGHNKWLRTNDIIRDRNDFMGSDVKEDPAGETFYVPLSLVPIDDTPPPPPADPPEDEPENEPDPEDPDKDDKEKAVKLDKKVKKKGIDRSPETIEQYRVSHYKIQAKYADLFQKNLIKVFDSMEKEILQRNHKAFEEWQFDDGKALVLATRLLKPVYKEEMIEEANLALEFMGDTDTSIEFTQKMNLYIDSRMTRFMGDTSRQLAQKLSDTIAEGVREGENLSKLRKRVEEVFATSRQRAERIARTETSAASNQGAIEAYRQSPGVQAKEFYAQYDACPFCAEMNGKIVGIDEDYFTIGESLELADGSKMHFNYDSVGHPPLHPNCECAILPVYLK